jgi:hypothetical protein
MLKSQKWRKWVRKGLKIFAVSFYVKSYERSPACLFIQRFYHLHCISSMIHLLKWINGRHDLPRCVSNGAPRVLLPPCRCYQCRNVPRVSTTRTEWRRLSSYGISVGTKLLSWFLYVAKGVYQKHISAARSVSVWCTARSWSCFISATTKGCHCGKVSRFSLCRYILREYSARRLTVSHSLDSFGTSLERFFNFLYRTELWVVQGSSLDSRSTRRRCERK